ncbi:hypothetical protein [Methanoplanus limicola]|jgi:hypothetical protein|uniref:Uncharacterized protein n=1 Tax=Methanoplanus limicola DSM 2279 TaxID=937775 RepID=H1YYT5_9EURY|nr:hypothetical protein [Methanoplanus limicola]EHQ37007.1 hypothetical protein Metlim_2975 [Methanoplanus limicola DSM 2279]
MGNLRPVDVRLKEELLRYGENVPVNSYVDMDEGTLWKKLPSGKMRNITRDPRNVLIALEHYGIGVEETRQRCREGRIRWDEFKK